MSRLKVTGWLGCNGWIVCRKVEGRFNSDRHRLKKYNKSSSLLSCSSPWGTSAVITFTLRRIITSTSPLSVLLQQKHVEKPEFRRHWPSGSKKRVEGKNTQDWTVQICSVSVQIDCVWFSFMIQIRCRTVCFQFSFLGWYPRESLELSALTYTISEN